MNCIRVPQILMPKEGTDLYKWSVIACDQFTSQPEYWEKTEEIVGDAPSTLKLTLPEVYLEGVDEAERVNAIHTHMEQYLKEGTLQQLPKGFVLVERSFGKQYARNGLVVAVDLEAYEYKKGKNSLIRPTEMTVEERIPPRLRVRQNAIVELPHIMLLIDDPSESVIEPLIARKNEFGVLYDTDLMQKGGHITGRFIPEGEETEKLMALIEGLADKDVFNEKYGLQEEYPLLNMAVGDGNLSMATAKASWEQLKQNLTADEIEQHPARYCLCEIVNIHDKSLEIEPIHRVVFNVEEEELLEAAAEYYAAKGCTLEVKDVAREPYANVDEHTFVLCSRQGRKLLKVKKPIWGIAVATLQNFLDDYLAKSKACKIDYIHGIDIVDSLSSKRGNVGFILPEVKKEDLFIGVIKDGVLPRKTFSMGEANEKRYYMECKMIL